MILTLIGSSGSQMAVAKARVRDMFHFQAAFASLAIPALLVQVHHGNKVAAAPILVLSFLLAYQWDMAYGNKMDRLRHMAEEMLRDEPKAFDLPAATGISVKHLDELIAAQIPARDSSPSLPSSGYSSTRA